MEQKDRTAAQRLDALVEKGRQAGAQAPADWETGASEPDPPAVKPPAPPPRNGWKNNYEQSINNIGKALDFPGGGV